MSPWLQWFFLCFWLLLISLMAIGGYFMFRKFLKRMPLADGKSVLDWQEFYIEQTVHLWTDEQKALLNELVSPVPELFRHIAKQSIAGKIGERVLAKNAVQIKEKDIIEGYILATPKRDHRWLVKKLQEKGIDLADYQDLLKN